MKQLARAFQAIVRGLLLVLQFSGSTVAMPVMENARTLADLPETERMDPLQIRRLYLSENRSTPVTADRCRALTTPERAMETAMHPNEMKYFKHVSVAPEPAVGWKSKMLCIAYTYEGDHTTKGIGMISTWMHRCDGAVLLSNKTDTALPSVDVPHIGPESYSTIWQKSRANWKYIYDNYFNEYEWFVFGGTDYYVIVENMRFYLESEEIQSLNAKNTPLYMGRRFATGGNMDKQFNSGGPSYVLNKAALQLFIVNMEKEICKPAASGSSEDVYIAACLKAVGNVLPYDTRDEKHRERFHPFTPGFAMFHKPPTEEKRAEMKAAGKKLDWYTVYSAWGHQTGLDCCNPHSIAWHYIKPDHLRQLDNLLYACRTPAFIAPGDVPMPAGILDAEELRADFKVKVAALKLARSRP